MKQFVVIGNPIAHSKSPEIHTTFAEQFGISLQYQRLLANRGAFVICAKHFFEHGSGANITVPFKEDAKQFADVLSDDARLAGAVNTLSQDNGKIKGDNTDGVGLVRDIRDNHGQTFTQKNILIIGAGGASRGVILPIARENPKAITIANRTHEKAQKLTELFSQHTHINAKTFDELNTPFDVIINATSASLSGQKLPLPSQAISTNTFAYDMMYGAEPTAFMQFTKSHGATTADGLGMLVEQAAKSFEIWHGVKPETQDIIENIRSQL